MLETIFLFLIVSSTVESQIQHHPKFRQRAPQSSIEQKIKEIESTLTKTDVAAPELLSELTAEVSALAERLDNISVRGRWCATRGKWTASEQTITYDKLFFSDTNMKITQPPFDIKSGIFVVPATGTWRVNYSILSKYSTSNYNTVYLYHQGQNVEEMQYWTVATDSGWSTGGREAFFNAKKNKLFISLLLHLEQCVHRGYRIL